MRLSLLLPLISHRTTTSSSKTSPGSPSRAASRRSSAPSAAPTRRAPPPPSPPFLLLPSEDGAHTLPPQPQVLVGTAVRCMMGMCQWNRARAYAVGLYVPEQQAKTFSASPEKQKAPEDNGAAARALLLGGGGGGAGPAQAVGARRLVLVMNQDGAHGPPPLSPSCRTDFLPGFRGAATAVLSMTPDGPARFPPDTSRREAHRPRLRQVPHPPGPRRPGAHPLRPRLPPTRLLPPLRRPPPTSTPTRKPPHARRKGSGRGR